MVTPACLTIVAPSIAAFSASIELCHGFVDASGLHHPPVSLIVVTFRALHLDLAHGLDALLFLSYDNNLVGFLVLPLDYGGLIHRFLGSAPGTLVSLCLMVDFAHCAALRAELRFYASLPSPYPELISFKPYEFFSGQKACSKLLKKLLHSLKETLCYSR